MDGRETVRVSYDHAMSALELHDGKVPGNPKVEVHLGPRLEDGSCALSVTGSPHTSILNVVKRLGIRELVPDASIATMGRSPIAQAVVDSRPAQTDSNDPGRNKAPTRPQRLEAPEPLTPPL